MRSIIMAIFLVLVVVSCGGGGLTLAEYAEQTEGLVTAMNGRIDALDVELRAEDPTVESTQNYFNQKLAARHEFLDGFQVLEPSEEVAEMHTAALDIVTRLTAAEEALAQWAEGVESIDELSRIWDTPEGLAMQAVDEEAIAICQAAQAQADSTADREALADFPWISPELQEVVVVFFGCTAEERGADS